jgi:hypothetical protein
VVLHAAQTNAELRFDEVEEVATCVFLNYRRKPAREVLGDAVVLHREKDLLVLHWDFEYSDLSDVDQAADELVGGLGVDLLYPHRDPRGVLLTPASLAPIVADDYAHGVSSYSPAGMWVPNRAREPSLRLTAAEPAEIPLPAYPRSRRLEFCVVKAAQAMRELELAEIPLRTLKLELATRATPREVSAFYLPLLKKQGLRVRRRIWSSGNAERLWGATTSAFGVVYSEKRGPDDTFVRVSWVLRH